MTDRRLPLAALAVATTLYGVAVVIVKRGIADFPPVAFVAWRFAVAGGVLLALSFPTQSRMWRDGAIAGVWLFAGYTLQTLGLEQADAGVVALITGLHIVIAPMVVAAWQRTRLSPWVVVAAVMAFIGLVLITIGESFGLGPGELTTLLGAVAFGVHIAYLARIAPRHVIVPLTAVQMIVTAGLGFVLSWFLEGPTLPTGPELPAVIGSGLAVSVGALLLQVWAQTRVGSARTASTLALVPLVGLLAGVAFLGERPLVEGWLGAAVIVAALQLVIVRNAEPETLVAQSATAAH